MCAECEYNTERNVVLHVTMSKLIETTMIDVQAQFEPTTSEVQIIHHSQLSTNCTQDFHSIITMECT